MTYSLARIGDDFVVMTDGGPVRTPRNGLVFSRYEALATELLTDVRARGPNPAHQFSMFSLQASHLDFTLRSRREEVAAGEADAVETDIWFNRPAFPPIELALDALWGSADREVRRRFPGRLRSLTRRGLTTVVVSGANLNSAQLAIEAITTSRDLTPLAMGACSAFFESLVDRHARVSDGTAHFRDRRAWRRSPSNADSEFCRACQRGDELSSSDRRAHCELLGYLELLRRFESFPEEPEPQSSELLRLQSGAGSDAPSSAEARAESDRHFDRATELAKADRLEEAAREYHLASEVLPSNAQALMYEGNCLYNLGRAEDALPILDRVAAMRPDVAVVWESRANVLNALDRDDEAIRDYERALAIDPTRVRSLVELTFFAINAKDHERALSLVDAALDLEPDHWYAHAKRGLALDRLGRREEALAAYERAIGLNGSHPETLNNYGVTLMNLGRREEARVQFRRALALAPGYPLAARNLAGLSK